MVSNSLADPLFADRQIKLDTLVRLRWLAIFGQSLAVIFVWLVLGYKFEAWLCLALIGLSAWLNLYLQLQFRKVVRLSALPATILLTYDSAQLGGLLYLTGGLQNPFSLLLLVPAVVSATTQPARYTIFLASLITLLATLLIWFNQPLPWVNNNPPELPLLYVFAIWTAILLTMIFLSIYAFRIAQEGQLLVNALSATELVLANEQHLTTLDGLATAAAHELGTPLATIQLVSRELERELFDDDPIKEEIVLLRSQAERCREILGTLRSLSGDEHANFTKMRLTSLISEVIEPFEDEGIEIRACFPESLEGQPVLMRNPGLIYGLGNLLENAVDFAHSRVDIKASWTETSITVRIMDDGPGFAQSILARLGDPYVTTRALDGKNGADNLSDIDSKAGGNIGSGGLGLGFFIAKTLLERSGAQVSVSNRQADNSGNRGADLPKEQGTRTGALIHLHWPRGQIEADQ